MLNISSKNIQKRIVGSIVTNWNTCSDFFTCNAVNLITCDRYLVQYAEETIQKLYERVNWRRTGLNQPQNYGFCPILSEYLKRLIQNAICSVYTQETLIDIDFIRCIQKSNTQMIWCLVQENLFLLAQRMTM